MLKKSVHIYYPVGYPAEHPAEYPVSGFCYPVNIRYLVFAIRLNHYPARPYLIISLIICLMISIICLNFSRMSEVKGVPINSHIHYTGHPDENQTAQKSVMKIEKN